MKPPDVIMFGDYRPKTDERLVNLYDLMEWANRNQDNYLFWRCFDRIKELTRHT
jgi:hypothetical protein